MTRTLLQQALDALHPQANRAFVEATKDALRYALAAPQPEPVAYQRLVEGEWQQCSLFVAKGFSNKLDADCRELFAAPPAAPAPAVHPDEFVCPYCFDQGAAPAVPVSWDRLRILMDGIPTREEFIGDQRQQYVAKEAVMSWLHEGQLRAKREAVQPAAPTVQVVLRQPNLFAPAPAVPLTREQQIAIREAHCNTASDEYFGARPQVGDVPRRRIYEAGFKEGWEIAHGIGGGGNG